MTLLSRYLRSGQQISRFPKSSENEKTERGRHHRNDGRGDDCASVPAVRMPDQAGDEVTPPRTGVGRALAGTANSANGSRRGRAATGWCLIKPRRGNSSSFSSFAPRGCPLREGLSVLSTGGVRHHAQRNEETDD